MTRRQGATLVDLLITIIGCSILLGLSAGLIQTAIRSGNIGSTHLSQRTTLDRLARQFRQDVRAAASIEPDGADEEHVRRLRIALTDSRTVEYLVQANEIVRIDQEGQQVTSRETFRLPIEEDGRIQVEREIDATWLRLVLPMKPLQYSRDSRREFRIGTVVSKDLRFGLREKQ